MAVCRRWSTPFANFVNDSNAFSAFWFDVNRALAWSSCRRVVGSQTTREREVDGGSLRGVNQRVEAVS